jgi:ribonuclease P/MRP protein subunit POP5
MRMRRRYIAFEIQGDERVSEEELIRGINSAVKPMNLSRQNSVRLIFYDTDSRRGLLRCGHLQVEEVKKVLEGTKELGGKKVKISILGVSGTIKKARKKFL